MALEWDFEVVARSPSGGSDVLGRLAVGLGSQDP